MSSTWFFTSSLGKTIRKWAGAPDFASEIEYWADYLSKRPARLFDPADRKSAFPGELAASLTELQGRRVRKPRLLEVGPGPVSLLAWGVAEGLFDITAIDPLANVYRELTARYDIDWPVKPIVGRGESLVRRFGERSFDAVYSSNALDHVVSPRRSLEQIMSVIADDGIICLEGFLREGTIGNWSGLHQHDLVPEDGHLLHFDRHGVRTVLTAGLRLQCMHQKVGLFRDRGIYSFGYDWDENGVIAGWADDEWYTMVWRVLPAGG